MLLDNTQVAIVGGGPGGLTLARLLQRKGVKVKGYERDVSKDIRVQGATLDLHVESGLKAIEAAGLMAIFKETYRPAAEKGRVVDQYATILYDEHDQGANQELGNESFRPEIDRADLRDLLLDSLQVDTVVWNSQLQNLSLVGDGWQLAFKNGTTVMADMVIGADGAHSKIRPLVTSITPFYAGITIFQGNVDDAATTAPNMHRLVKGGKLYTHAGGKYVHVSAKGDGSIDFYVSMKMPENWVQTSGIDFSDRTQLLTWFENEFPVWDRIWFELFEQVSLPLLVRPQFCVPFDQRWDAQSSITLLGDAAHIMPPSGEGVNLAMLDALDLSECLTSDDFTDTQTAIAAYENRMRTRAAAEAQASLDMVEWMHEEGASEKLVQLFTEIAEE